MSSEGYRERCYQHHSKSCSACSSDERLEVHHIDGDAGNDTYSNLIPLCVDCHETVERDCWTDDVGAEMRTSNPLLRWLIRKKRASSSNTEESARQPAGDLVKLTQRMPSALVVEVDRVQEEYALPSRNAAINFIVKQGIKEL